MLKKYHKTAQRAAIMQYLKNNKHHPNIADIYNNVSKKLSTISMTTVYNTMDLLKKDGLVYELSAHNGGGVRFESNLIPHDHLICNVCGNIFDVNVDHSLLTTEKEKDGFDIKGIRIQFHGVCSDCKNRDRNVGISS